MRIEGYLFLPYGGQYRFGFEVHQEDNHLRIGQLLESKRVYDYLWDVNLRSAPTLHELTDTGVRPQIVRRDHERAIISEFRLAQDFILNSRMSRIKRTYGKEYRIEFVRVE
jgi:hypothetical protein